MANRFVNPVPQFTDSAGNPLLDAELNFYTDETLTTRKDTFADANEDIANPNPLPLDGDGRTPNVFYAGTATVQLTNDTGSGQQQVWRADGVGAFGSGSAFDIWNPITEYEDGALVEASDGEYYRSLQDNNIGNDPISSPTFWEQVSFLRTWNPNITYDLGDGGVVGSDGKQYRSLQAANLNNDPISSPAFWGVNNPFDQDLNTTDKPTFAGMTLTNDLDFTNANPEILGGDTDGVLIISANTESSGANIILYGDTHATKAGDIDFRRDGSGTLTFDFSATVWDFKTNDIVTTGALGSGAITTSGDLIFSGANPEIVGGDTDGTLIITSNTSSLGANIVLYGDTHATNAGDIDFRNNNSGTLTFDLSALAWDFKANAITTTGDISGANGTFSGTVRKNGTHPAVSAFNSVTDSNVTGDDTEVTVVYDTETLDQGGDWSSGTFTAPVSGLYNIATTVQIGGLTSSHVDARLFISASNGDAFLYRSNPFNASVGGTEVLNGSASIFMDASDTFTIQLSVHDGTKVVDILGGATITFISVELAA